MGYRIWGTAYAVPHFRASFSREYAVPKESRKQIRTKGTGREYAVPSRGSTDREGECGAKEEEEEEEVVVVVVVEEERNGSLYRFVLAREIL
jgi:hypothetical protein